LGPELKRYPEDDAALWAFAQEWVVLNNHHPKFIVKLLKSSRVCFAESKQFSKVMIVEAVDAILEGVTLKAVRKACFAMGDMFHLVTIAFKAVNLNHKMVDAVQLKNETMLEELEMF